MSKHKFPYNYVSVGLTSVNGSATFIGNPTQEQIDAVNELAKVAFKKFNSNNMNNALWLVAEGDYVLLKIEKEKGVWVTLIKERLDAPFSHIVEPSGIESKLKPKNK